MDTFGITQARELGQDGRGGAIQASGGATPSPARIIVDLTDLIGNLSAGRGVSGIQRVVLEFTKAGSEIAREQKIALMFGYFDQLTNQYYALETALVNDVINAQSLDGIFSSDLFKLRSSRPINLPKMRAKYEHRAIKRHWHLTFAHLRIASRRTIQSALSAFAAKSQLTPLAFRQGDIFLMLGSGWDALPLFDYIDPLRKAGIIKPIILIHDLIPILNLYRTGIDLRGDGVAQASVFRAWLDRAAHTADQFIAISNATRNDLMLHFAHLGRGLLDVRVINLPHEFTAPVQTSMSPAVSDILEQNFALFVGPVSGRKNARRLLEAWAQVIKRIGPERTPVLVITAKDGADAVYATHIRPILTHVRVLDRPNDFELSKLYARAAFTVFPSLYEGWGLPVGESLWHGTPCITSNGSSLPEVGGPLCDYVDPMSVESIAAGVERLAGDPRYRESRARAIKTSEMRLWRDFAQDILDLAQSGPDQSNLDAVTATRTA